MAALACLLAVSTAASSCSASPPPVAIGSDRGGYAAGTPVQDGPPLPDETLVGPDGRALQLPQAADKPVSLVFFGYAHCPDVCPGVLADLALALRRAGQPVRDRVRVVVITTDPARDTPEALAAYLGRFDPEFVGLTGETAHVLAAAKALGVEIEDGRRLASGGYEVTHGAQVLGFGPDARLRVVWTQGVSVADLAADIARLAAE